MVVYVLWLFVVFGVLIVMCQCIIPCIVVLNWVASVCSFCLYIYVIWLCVLFVFVCLIQCVCVCMSGCPTQYHVFVCVYVCMFVFCDSCVFLFCKVVVCCVVCFSMCELRGGVCTRCVCVCLFFLFWHGDV